MQFMFCFQNAPVSQLLLCVIFESILDKRLHFLFTCLDLFVHTYESKRHRGNAGIRRGKLANYYLRYASNPSKCPAREALLLGNDTGKGRGWFRIMEERVTLLHRTHVFAAFCCITRIVCNFDNVCLITCLQPQLIPLPSQ